MSQPPFAKPPPRESTPPPQDYPAPLDTLPPPRFPPQGARVRPWRAPPAVADTRLGTSGVSAKTLLEPAQFWKIPGLSEQISLPSPPRDEAAAAYRAVRARTEALCAALETEDFVAQSMPDASPVKWHLGHTSWFFETVLLARFSKEPPPNDPALAPLFNSYYESLGPRWRRENRGLLTRPTVKEVFALRRRVDEAMEALLRAAGEAAWREILPLLDIGLAHEEQHQELLLTDLKHLLSLNPLAPHLDIPRPAAAQPAGPAVFRGFAGGLVWAGRQGPGFAYDNESPRHKVHLEPFELADRPVTNAEVLAFIAEGGYDDFRHWLSDGWAKVRQESWRAPLYWEKADGEWFLYSLAGRTPVDPAETAAHLSYFEAAALARWAGARLPTEFEWEAAATELGPEGRNFLDDGRLHPEAALGGFAQLQGNVWEWTASAYLPYPGYTEYQGALAEYNGKFMSGQMVLRGGSCATPRRHIRPTYRNFFPPDKRWQFSGLRLAR